MKLLKRDKRKVSREARLLNQSVEVDVDEHDGLSLPSSTDADTDDESLLGEGTEVNQQKII